MNYLDLIKEIKNNVVEGVVSVRVSDSKVIKNDNGTFIIFKLETEDDRKFDVCYSAQINFMNTIQTLGELQDEGVYFSADVKFDGKYFNMKVLEGVLLG